MEAPHVILVSYPVFCRAYQRGGRGVNFPPAPSAFKGGAQIWKIKKNNVDRFLIYIMGFVRQKYYEP